MKLLIADDHGLFRDSMAIWLSQHADISEIDFAEDWPSLIDKVSSDIDIILLDLSMPGMQGAISVELLKKQLPATPILIVSANENPDTINSCLQSGASGYITKSSSGPEILEAVTAVLNNQSYCSKPQVTAQHSFSKKQFELLAFLAKGESNRNIAEKMNLSEGTIKQYVSQLFRLLDVDNRTQAASKARVILGS